MSYYEFNPNLADLITASLVCAGVISKITPELRFNIDAPVWVPPEPVAPSNLERNTDLCVIRPDDINPQRPVDIDINGLNIPAYTIMCALNGLEGFTKTRISTALMKWMRDDVKKDRKFDSIYCVINYELLTDYAVKIWELNQLPRLTVAEIPLEKEIEARIKVLSWLYFKKDILSSSCDFAFPDLTVKYTQRLVEAGFITLEEKVILDSSVFKTEDRKRLLGAKPYSNLSIPTTQLRFKIDSLVDKGIPAEGFKPNNLLVCLKG